MGFLEVPLNKFKKSLKVHSTITTCSLLTKILRDWFGKRRLVLRTLYVHPIILLILNSSFQASFVKKALI